MTLCRDLLQSGRCTPHKKRASSETFKEGPSYVVSLRIQAYKHLLIGHSLDRLLHECSLAFLLLGLLLGLAGSFSPGLRQSIPSTRAYSGLIVANGKHV
jgi:hypothetical protein